MGNALVLLKRWGPVLCSVVLASVPAFKSAGFYAEASTLEGIGTMGGGMPLAPTDVAAIGAMVGVCLKCYSEYGKRRKQESDDEELRKRLTVDEIRASREPRSYE